MTTEIAPAITIGPEERALLVGDLSKLTPDQRATLVTNVCRSLGLNPLTRPFEYITLNGKLTLYARKDCTDQLRTLHGISLRVSKPEVVDDILYVTAHASTPAGRTDEDYGAVYVGGLKGEARANALLRCVPLDAEILTRDGWKSYREVARGEEVLGYDVERDQTAWTSLDAVNVYEALPMGELRTPAGRTLVRCTVGHRWAVEKEPYKPRVRVGSPRGRRGPYRTRGPERCLLTVEEMVSVAGRRLIIAAPERTTSGSLLSPVEAAVLGWAVTDGTIKRVGNSVRIGICQSKDDIFAPIRELVAAAAPGTRELVSPPVRRTFPSSGQTSETRPQHWWYIPSAVSRAILDKAGFHDRCDLPRIVTRLDAAARRAFLHAVMLAEGDRTSRRFANTDRHILDAFQIACTLEGIALGKESSQRPYEGYKPLVTQRPRMRRHILTHNLRFDVQGIEPAWCPTTGLGTWIMRQNGRVMITGNCLTKAKRRVTLSVCGLGMLDETEVESIPGARPLGEGPDATGVTPAPRTSALAAPSPAAGQDAQTRGRVPVTAAPTDEAAEKRRLAEVALDLCARLAIKAPERVRDWSALGQEMGLPALSNQNQLTVAWLEQVVARLTERWSQSRVGDTGTTDLMAALPTPDQLAGEFAAAAEADDDETKRIGHTTTFVRLRDQLRPEATRPQLVDLATEAGSLHLADELDKDEYEELLGLIDQHPHSKLQEAAR